MVISVDVGPGRSLLLTPSGARSPGLAGDFPAGNLELDLCLADESHAEL